MLQGGPRAQHRSGAARVPPRSPPYAAPRRAPAARPSCGLRVTLQLPQVPATTAPWGETGTSPSSRVIYSPLGLHEWCLQPTELWKNLEKKEPNAQKPRLNKASSGRAAVRAWERLRGGQGC